MRPQSTVIPVEKLFENNQKHHIKEITNSRQVIIFCSLIQDSISSIELKNLEKYKCKIEIIPT